MAKQKKNNHLVIPPVPREAIAAVRGEEEFVELLRRELEWPIPMSVQPAGMGFPAFDDLIQTARKFQDEFNGKAGASSS